MVVVGAAAYAIEGTMCISRTRKNSETVEIQDAAVRAIADICCLGYDLEVDGVAAQVREGPGHPTGGCSKSNCDAVRVEDHVAADSHYPVVVVRKPAVVIATEPREAANVCALDNVRGLCQLSQRGGRGAAGIRQFRITGARGCRIRDGASDDASTPGMSHRPATQISRLEVAVDDTHSTAGAVEAGGSLTGRSGTDSRTGTAVVDVILQVGANTTAERGARSAGEVAHAGDAHRVAVPVWRRASDTATATIV